MVKHMIVSTFSTIVHLPLGAFCSGTIAVTEANFQDDRLLLLRAQLRLPLALPGLGSGEGLGFGLG